MEHHTLLSKPTRSLVLQNRPEYHPSSFTSYILRRLSPSASVQGWNIMRSIFGSSSSQTTTRPEPGSLTIQASVGMTGLSRVPAEMPCDYHEQLQIGTLCDSIPSKAMAVEFSFNLSCCIYEPADFLSVQQISTPPHPPHNSKTTLNITISIKPSEINLIIRFSNPPPSPPSQRPPVPPHPPSPAPSSTPAPPMASSTASGGERGGGGVGWMGRV